MSEVDFERTVDTCLDLHLLRGTPDLSMHRLFSTFLREALPSAEDQTALGQVRIVQARRFVQLANALSANPADTQTASALMSYPLAPRTWATLAERLSLEEGSAVGRALYEIGRFDEARPWFERAVAEKEKGDVHGRIDHASLCISLNATAACLRELGLDELAREWDRRASNTGPQ